MKTKGPRRYETANQIRDAVDRYKAKAQKLRERAAALDFTTDQMVKGGEVTGAVATRRTIADKLRESAARIEDRQLTKLKQKLAEWQTEPMKGMFPDGDRSIPVKG